MDRGQGKGADWIKIGGLADLALNLKHQLNAKKREYFTDCGVKRFRLVPDNMNRLRALIELSKLHNLCPRRGEWQAGDRYDRSERPVIHIVIENPAGKPDKI
jgi:hypothetical protein